jgi:serine/threonine protein phosphatase PrpC
MRDAQGTLAVRCGVQSDIGLHRPDNEDSAYAGARLLAVADGMGGHAGGEVASAAVIEALRPLDTEVPAGELLSALDHAVRRASSALRDIVLQDPSLLGMGTTLTALLWSGSQLGLVARVLLTITDPDQAAKDLIALAIDGGGPDNITCIVADVVTQEAPAPEAPAP